MLDTKLVCTLLGLKCKSMKLFCFDTCSQRIWISPKVYNINRILRHYSRAGSCAPTSYFQSTLSQFPPVHQSEQTKTHQRARGTKCPKAAVVFNKPTNLIRGPQPNPLPIRRNSMQKAANVLLRSICDTWYATQNSEAEEKTEFFFSERRWIMEEEAAGDPDQYSVQCDPKKGFWWHSHIAFMSYFSWQA